MTNKEAIEELKKVDTLDMPARLCEAHYMAIKALEQEPKTGHWILGICDNCGYDWSKDAPIASVPNYCPNCGAKMFEPQAESEDKE